MKKAVAWVLIAIIAAGAVALVWYVIKGYFMISVKGGELYDGLGRKVSESPGWFRMMTQQESWPGVKATVIDIIVFWISVAILGGLTAIVRKLNDNE